MDLTILGLIIFEAAIFFGLGYWSASNKKFNSNERKSVRKHSKAKEVCKHILHEPDAAKGNYHCGKCGASMKL